MRENLPKGKKQRNTGEGEGECECRGGGGTCQGGNPHKGSCKELDFWWQEACPAKEEKSLMTFLWSRWRLLMSNLSYPVNKQKELFTKESEIKQTNKQKFWI